MKKLIVVAITLFIGTTAFSQELDLGIKAGANFANISDVNDLSSKTGFQAGVFAGIKFTDKVGIQADLLYSQQGAEFDAGEFDLTYVNVPVVLKYYLVKGLNIQAGPQFGFIVDDNIADVLGNIYEAESSDVSGIIGAGYDFPFGIRVDARYNFGLSDVSKDVDGKNKNNVFSVALGYSFL
ncbi:PorT family protein [Aequorivita sp. F47161]|uniref:PorT family protein n=1 Tax=Aequorivita vitellina TaxID=2874475 RepID=A0A9X1QWX0_9FLAO|nr:porin family protein [Aequorivita vitellina]MCG2418887.1 PorT family protein [Aequorivita vitellina]MCZ4318949.1 porin family protein [Aequorivita viscosa]